MPKVPPLSVTSQWPPGNFVNPETRGNLLFLLCILFLAIVPVVAGCRMWARCVILRKPGLDDLFFCFALVPIIGFTIICMLANKSYYFDRHIWDVPLSAYVSSTLVLYIAEVTSHIGSSLLKISILLFYKRLTASGHSIRFFYAVRFAILFVILWAFAILVVLLTACTPLDAFWKTASVSDPYTKPYTCLGERIYWPLNVSVSVLTDFVTVLIPVWMVKGLDVSRRQKSMLYMVFGLGILTCVAGIFRLVYTIRPLLITFDAFWEGYALAVASVVEFNVAVLLCSAPALKPFFDRSILNPSRGRSSVYIRPLNDWSPKPFDSRTDVSSIRSGAPLIHHPLDAKLGRDVDRIGLSKNPTMRSGVSSFSGRSRSGASSVSALSTYPPTIPMKNTKLKIEQAEFVAANRF